MYKPASLKPLVNIILLCGSLLTIGASMYAYGVTFILLFLPWFLSPFVPLYFMNRKAHKIGAGDLVVLFGAILVTVYSYFAWGGVVVTRFRGGNPNTNFLAHFFLPILELIAVGLIWLLFKAVSLMKGRR